MLRAAGRIRDEGFAQVVAAGRPGRTRRPPARRWASIRPASRIIDPLRSSCRPDYVRALLAKRQPQGHDRGGGRRAPWTTPCSSARCWSAQGVADGMVAGAVNSTGNVLRAGFQIVGTAPGHSRRLQLLRDGQAGLGTAARTACSSSATAPSTRSRTPTSWRTSPWPRPPPPAPSAASSRAWPCSASRTMGSGAGPDVDKVIEAARLVQREGARAAVDGPLQLDAAIVPNIGAQQGAGQRGRRPGQRADLPGPGRRQHRLQAGAAPGRAPRPWARSCRAWPRASTTCRAAAASTTSSTWRPSPPCRAPRKEEAGRCATSWSSTAAAAR